MKRLRLSLSPWRALLLAVVLLGAQALGLSHRIAHGSLVAAGQAQVQVQARGEARWGDHVPASAQCRLYDQLLGHADGLVSAAPTQAPPAPVALPTREFPTPQATRHVAAYQARGPPQS